MRKHSRSSKHGGFKEVFLNPNDKGSGNHAQGANRGRTVLNLSSKLGSYHLKLSCFIEIFLSGISATKISENFMTSIYKNIRKR